MENKFKLKKFLATASAFAMITGASSAAMGAQQTDNNVNVTLANGGGTVGLNGGGNFANNDSFYFSNAGKTLTTAGAVTIASIDLNNQAPGLFTVAHAVTVGPIVDVAGKAANTPKKLNITINDGLALTLANNAGKDAGNLAIAAGSFDGVGNITLGSGGGGSSIVANTDATLTGTINSDNNEDGTITVNAGKAVTFDGIIGGTKKLDSIKLGGALSKATFNANSTVDTLELDHATAEATIGDGVTFTGAIDATNAGDEGILNFAGSGIVTGAIGGGNELNLVNFNGAGAVQLQAASEATTFKVNHAGAIANFNHNVTGDVNFTADGTVNVADDKTITGEVDSNGANTGVLNFAGRGAVTAAIGATQALKEVNVNGTTGVGVVAFGDEVKAQKITVNNAGAKVTFAEDVTAANGLQFSADGQVTVAAGNKTITGAVKNTVAAGGDGKFADTGKLIFTAGGGGGAGNPNGTVTGAIGEEGKALSLVHIVGAGDVSLTAGNTAHHAATFKFDDADSRLLVAAGSSLVGNLVAVANSDGKVRFAGAGEIQGTIGNAAGFGVGLIEANGAGIVKIGAGNHKAAFATRNAGAGFTFADGANVTGTIDNTSGGVNNTALTFEGSSTVTGAVGGTAALKTITVTGGTNKNVKFEDAVEATTLNIGKNDQEGAAKVTIGDDLTVTDVLFLDNKSQSGELEIAGAGAHAITGGINSAAAAADETRGTVTIAADVAGNAVTFDGQIGDTANKKGIRLLNILNDNAGGSVVLEGGDVHIAKIQAAGQGILKLNEADANYKFGEIALDSDNQFKLVVHENAVLKGPAEGSVNFGNTDNGLKSLDFTANKNLTIENGINIYSTKLNESGVNNNGTLIFTGDSIFSAKSDGQNIAGVKVQGANKTVKLLQDIKANGNIELSDNATLEVAGNVTAADIKGAAGNGQGTLRFINTGDTTVTGTVGAGNKLQSIEFAGGNVTFANAVTHGGQDFIFNGKNASVVKFDVALANDSSNFVNNSEANGVEHIVELANDQNFTGNLAVDNAATKQIAFDIGTGDNKATLQGAVQADGAKFINRGASGRGTLELNKDGLTIYSAGTDTKKLDTIEVQESATITNGASADTLTIKTGKTGTIGGVISGTNFDLEGAGSTARFLDGATLKVAVADTAGDKGIVEFLGGGTVEAGNTIGADGGNRVKMVTFSDVAGKTLTFGSKVFANETINIRKGTFKPGNDDVVLNAPNVNAQNASFDLGSNGKVTVNNGNLTFSGTEGKIAVAIAQAGNTISGGQIVAGTGSTLKYDAGSAVTVTADDANGSRPSAGASRTFTLIKNDSGNAVVGTLTVNPVVGTNPFTKWSSSFDNNGNLILTQVDGAADKIKELLGGNLDAVDSANVDALTNAEAGTDAAKFITVLEDFARTNNKAKIDEALDRLTSVSTATDSIENTMNELVNGIGTRLSLVGKQTAGTPVQSRTVASAKVTGVAAGDEHARYGAWFSPFFSKTTQKARKGAAGYRDTTYGGSFGMDTRANDDLILGAAVTFANSEMKHRDFKSGDKTKVNSLMFSIYALQQITDTWFAQGSATIASNEVKNSEKRVRNATAFDTVNGKYNSMSFVGDALFGYNYATADFTLTPMGGVRYTRVNSAGYKESGSTTGQNLNVSQKASNKFEVVVGARVSGGTFDVNGMSVTPELHGFINHDVIGKNPKQDLRIGGAPTSLTAKSRKPVKTSYNLGLGVNADYGMMEYGVGYDVHLAEKRVGHEGSLKVRVNF